MAGEPSELTIEELADRAGVSVRTVRYYISQGLLAGPGARGRSAAYTDEHLARLRLIRRLAEQHVPLGEQRQRLDGLSHAEVSSLLGDEDRRGRALSRAEAARSPRDYVAALLTRARAARAESPAPVPPAPVPAAPQPAAPQPAAPVLAAPVLAAASGAGQPLAEAWQKWQLGPGLELHARADATRATTQLIERLLEIAREAQGHGRDPGSTAAFPHGDPAHANGNH